MDRACKGSELLVSVVVIVAAGAEKMDWLLLLIVRVLLRLANCLMERFVRRDEAGNRRALAITLSVTESRMETLEGCRNIQDIMAVLEEIMSRAPGGVHHAHQTGGRTSDAGASSSHGGNMSINGSEQPPRETEEDQDLYFDKGSAIAGVCCCVQLGGLTGADFAVSKLLPAACYIAVAAVAFILSLFVLVWCHNLPHGVRKFCLFVAFFFLFLDYWFIKPLLP